MLDRLIEQNTKTIELFGYRWTFHILSCGEYIRHLQKFKVDTLALEVKIKLLAKAIDKIDNEEIDLKEKLLIFPKLPVMIIEELYNKYILFEIEEKERLTQLPFLKEKEKHYIENNEVTDKNVINLNKYIKRKKTIK